MATIVLLVAEAHKDTNIDMQNYIWTSACLLVTWINFNPSQQG